MKKYEKPQAEWMVFELSENIAEGTASIVPGTPPGED